MEWHYGFPLARQHFPLNNPAFGVSHRPRFPYKPRLALDFAHGVSRPESNHSSGFPTGEFLRGAC